MNKPVSKKKKIIDDPQRVLTLANLISMLRASSAIPIIYTLNYPEWHWLTAIIILVAALSDSLDGYFARRAKEVTHLGMWLDPIADFVVITAVVLYLVILKMFPLWFFLFYIIRHIMVAAPAIYFVNHGMYILSANWWGKWGAGITTLAVFVHIWPWEAFPWMQDVTIYIATILLLISWLYYIKTFFNSYKELK